MPNPSPSLAERIHRAWNDSGPPEQQWIVEAADDEVIVMDNTDRSLSRVPVVVDGDTISFGVPERVRPAYVPADEPVVASRLVFASEAESRPLAELPPEVDQDPAEDGDEVLSDPDPDELGEQPDDPGEHVAAHATHNQKTHGRRYKVPGDRSSGLRESNSASKSISSGGNSKPTSTAPAGSRPSGRTEQRRLGSYSERRDAANEYSKMTRGEFDKLPAGDRDRILEDLRQIRDSPDTYTVRRGSGNISGVTAPHRDIARSKIREFTDAETTPVDNSPAARAERLKNATDSAGARRELTGATISDMREIADANGWNRYSESWSRDKMADFLVSRAAGEAGPEPVKIENARQAASTLGGLDSTGGLDPDARYRGGRALSNYDYLIKQIKSAQQRGPSPTPKGRRFFKSNMAELLRDAAAVLSGAGGRDTDIAKLRGLADFYDPTVRASVDDDFDSDDDTFEPPAAEPDHAPSTEPKEDSVSTLSADVRNRLGLPEDADDAAVLAALDTVKAKADTAPTDEQIKASAAADQQRQELEKEVKVLASQVDILSRTVAAAEKEKASMVKASVLDDAIKQGKIKPNDKDQWAKDYDEAPGAITRVLASIAPGTAVPVNPAGEVTDPNSVDVDTEWAAFAHMFPATSKEG